MMGRAFRMYSIMRGMAAHVRMYGIIKETSITLYGIMRGRAMILYGTMRRRAMTVYGTMRGGT